MRDLRDVIRGPEKTAETEEHKWTGRDTAHGEAVKPLPETRKFGPGRRNHVAFGRRAA